MCGIFAWAGENVKHFNKAKFDILGIFNDSRGGDSCGVSTDGEIYYGVLTGMKKYSQFIVEKEVIKEINQEVTPSEIIAGILHQPATKIFFAVGKSTFSNGFPAEILPERSMK